jgi:type I restriction enzyme S subunit
VTLEGWSKRTIGELCEFSSGYGFRPPDWFKEGLPIIRIQNLNGSKGFHYFNGTPDETWLVEPGTILFAWAGTRGVSFGPTIWHGPRGVLNQHIYRVHPREEVNPLWLYEALEAVTRNIERKAHGFKATLLHVRKEEITSQIVHFPPPREQQRIVDILSTWNRAIDLTTQLIAVKQVQKRGLMQQLFTKKTRFPHFNEHWQTVRIGDFLSENKTVGSDGRTALKITVKLYGKGVVPKEERNVGSAATKYYRRRAGQFIYSKLDFLNGAFGIIPPEMDGYESTLDLPCFDFKGTVLPQFFLYFVSRECFYSRFAGAAIGGRKARRIQVEEFLATEIEIAKMEEQERIVAVLSSYDRELALLNQKLDLLKKQKQGLMQQLLTGKVRVET